MNPLRHMAMDYVMHRLTDDRPRPAASAPRSSLFDVLREDLHTSGAFGHRGRGSAVRASDADREETVAELKRHYAQGRLDTDELTARVESAYGARHLGELTPLTRDLPATPPPAAAAPARPRRARPTVGLSALALTAFLVVAFASVMPAEAWAPLVVLVLSLAPLALFALAPLALLAIPLLLLRSPRVLTRVGPGHGRHSMLSERGRGWVAVRRL